MLVVSMTSLPPLRHGIPGVDGQIHEDLLDLPRIGFHVSQGGVSNQRQVDILTDQTSQHLLHVRDEGVQVQNPRRQHLLPAEGQQLSRQ